MIAFLKRLGLISDRPRADGGQTARRSAFLPYIVDRVVEESPEVKSFHLKRADGGRLDPYKPGQHLLCKAAVPEDGAIHLRAYSLSDAPGGDTYRISVKRETTPPGHPNAPPGLVSSFLFDRFRTGDRLEARGPLGEFTPDLESRKPIVLIAGGIGIAPILAMLKGCLRRHPKRPIHLFLAFKDAGREIFRAETEALLARHPQVRRHLFLSRAGPEDVKDRTRAHARRIDARSVINALPHLDMQFYLCGPRSMMSDLSDGIHRAGVMKSFLHVESFNTGSTPPEPESPAVPFDIVFARSNKNLRWNPAFRSLLEFAVSNGIPMEAGCLFGECGACSTRIEKGDVVYNRPATSQPRPGHCLPCSCRPASALTLDA